MIKNIQMPSKREALTVTVIMALFLLLTSIFIGLRSEHLLMAVLYLVLFFAGLPTRKLAVALLPFAIFGISYDWMRICPNYEVNPIDGAEHADLMFFQDEVWQQIIAFFKRTYRGKSHLSCPSYIKKKDIIRKFFCICPSTAVS
jgi:hypothetical protein